MHRSWIVLCVEFVCAYWCIVTWRGSWAQEWHYQQHLSGMLHLFQIQVTVLKVSLHLTFQN